MMLFAQALSPAEAQPVVPAPRPPAKPRELGWYDYAAPYLTLAAALTALAVFMLWYRRSVRDASERLSASELLTQAREWEEEGELTVEEYRKLKENLTPALKTTADPRKNRGDPAHPPRPKNP